MWGKDRTKKDKVKRPCYEKSRVSRQIERDNLSAPDGIIDWADRIITQVRTNEKDPGRGVSKSPIAFILISTLTVLLALVALFCIYK